MKKDEEMARREEREGGDDSSNGKRVAERDRQSTIYRGSWAVLGDRQRNVFK